MRAIYFDFEAMKSLNFFIIRLLFFDLRLEYVKKFVSSVYAKPPTAMYYERGRSIFGLRGRYVSGCTIYGLPVNCALHPQHNVLTLSLS